MTSRVHTTVLALALAACANGATSDQSNMAADVAAGVRRSDGARIGSSLASGTRVDATIQDALSSHANKPGETLHATVSHDVTDARGDVVMPAGSSLSLTIDQLEPAADHLRPEGRLSLAVSSATVNGRDYPLTADLAPVAHHLEDRGTGKDAERNSYRDVVVSAGTPIVLTLTHTLNISAR